MSGAGDLTMKHLMTMGALAALMLAPATAATAQGLTPILTYTGDPFTVIGGDGPKGSTYAHAVTFGFDAPVTPWLTATLVGAWTAGKSLSEETVGDTAGIQGAFNSGDYLWLYQAALTATYQDSFVTLGRISAGDYFGQTEPMGQFVHSAFSSNGGSISVNDAGRATAPSSSWGVTAQMPIASNLTARGGAFLSNPALFEGSAGVDLSFKPRDGVIGFAELDLTAGGWTFGLGGWTDSAPLQTFGGLDVNDNHGAYAFVSGPLWTGEGERGLTGFAMIHDAPQADRNLQPRMVLAGLVLTGPLAARPADILAFGAQSGEYSNQSGLDGRETSFELNYRITVDKHWGVRPDLQYIVDPGGRDGDAWVAGVQIEYDIGS